MMDNREIILIKQGNAIGCRHAIVVMAVVISFAVSQNVARGACDTFSTNAPEIVMTVRTPIGGVPLTNATIMMTVSNCSKSALFAMDGSACSGFRVRIADEDAHGIGYSKYGRVCMEEGYRHGVSGQNIRAAETLVVIMNMGVLYTNLSVGTYHMSVTWESDGSAAYLGLTPHGGTNYQLRIDDMPIKIVESLPTDNEDYCCPAFPADLNWAEASTNEGAANMAWRQDGQLYR